MKWRLYDPTRAKEMVIIFCGLALVALGLNLFLIPNKIAAGGVSGIAIVLYHLLHLPVGSSMLVMNLILFGVAFCFLGKGFGGKSILATIGLSVLTDFFAYALPTGVFTHDLMIATIFGNLMTGAGMAMIFNQDASTGGTDILAKLLNHFTAIDIGKSLLVFDFIIGVAAGLTLRSVEVGMYSLLGILINTFSIDIFISMITLKKQVWIISQRADEIAARIQQEMERGITYFHGEGGFTHTDWKIVMSVVRPRQMPALRHIVHEIDAKAFVIIGSVNEVLGEGFQKIKQL